LLRKARFARVILAIAFGDLPSEPSVLRRILQSSRFVGGYDLNVEFAQAAPRRQARATSWFSTAILIADYTKLRPCRIIKLGLADLLYHFQIGSFSVVHGFHGFTRIGVGTRADTARRCRRGWRWRISF